SDKATSAFATVVSALTLLFTASGVFLELEEALNAIWEIKPRSEKIAAMARGRALSVGLVIALGFLLIVSLVVDAALKSMGAAVKAYVPFGATLLLSLNFAASFTMLTVIMAAIMRYLPATRLSWRNVLGGAAFTAFLFVVGKLLIALYLASSATISALGAA